MTTNHSDATGGTQQLIARSVLAKLNDVLDGGVRSLEQAAGEDQSPEATAARIVGRSTELLPAYAAQYPDEDAVEVARRFVALVRASVDRNIDDTRRLLSDLGVLQGDIAANIDRTQALVGQHFDAFLADLATDGAAG